jgi:hypothetical protein
VKENTTSFIATLLTLGCLGCGPTGPEIARVEGTVKMDGKPLEDAAVVFIPENGRPAGSRTDKDGHYVLNFSEGRAGAIPGKSSVRITTAREASETADGKPIPAAAETIPMKYNTQSELVFTVEPGKKNIANFDLVSGGSVGEKSSF